MIWGELLARSSPRAYGSGRTAMRSALPKTVPAAIFLSLYIVSKVSESTCCAGTNDGFVVSQAGVSKVRPGQSWPRPGLVCET